MTLLIENRSYPLLQKAILLGVLIGFAMVILGWILIPATDLLSVLAVCLILALYGLVNYFGLPPKNHPDVLRWASIFGLITGIIFVHNPEHAAQ